MPQWGLGRGRSVGEGGQVIKAEDGAGDELAKGRRGSWFVFVYIFESMN